MTALEIITEWRRGCSCAPKENPEYCPECTRAMIDALERKFNDFEIVEQENVSLSHSNLVCLLRKKCGFLNDVSDNEVLYITQGTTVRALAELRISVVNFMDDVYHLIFKR